MNAPPGIGRTHERAELVLSGFHLWPGSFTGVVMLTVALLPVAVLAVWTLAARRGAAGVPGSSAWRTSIADVGIVYGTVPFVWMTMMPGSQAGAVSGAVSLVPLRDLATMSQSQVVGNLLILAALGFLAPIRWAALASLPRIVALAACCSATIESAQYLLQLDRVSSVDDILLNTAGAGVAALASRGWWRRRPARRSRSGAGHDREARPAVPSHLR